MKDNEVSLVPHSQRSLERTLPEAEEEEGNNDDEDGARGAGVDQEAATRPT